MISYKKPLLLSLALHLAVFIFLLINFDSSKTTYVQKKAPAVEIVQAVSINATSLEKEVSRIKKQRVHKKYLANKQKQEFNRQLRLAKKERLKEEAKLKAIKKQQLEVAHKKRIEQIKAKEHLALLKVKRKKEEDRLKRLKKVLEQEKKAELAKKKEKEAQLKKQLAEKKKKEALAEKERQIKQAEIARKKAEHERLIAGEVNKFKTLIIAAISENWILPPSIDKNLSCKFEIHLASDGEVLRVKLLRSSGSTVLDRSAQTAIYKASPLPVPSSPDAFSEFKVVSLTVRPESVLADSY